MPRRGDVHRRPYSRPQSLDPGTALPAMPIRYNIVAVKLYTYVYVPGYTHFATSIDMALTLGPSLDVRVETSEQLSSQLAKSQRESKELKEKLLRAEAKAYLLAKHLRDHNCEEYEDLIESMLREKPHFLEGQLAEELLPAENLKKCGVQIQEQAQELTQLQQKLQEGRALSQLIHQNLQALLTQQDPDSCQSRQLLTELLKLTEHLVAKLSTVNQTSGNQEEPYVDSPHTSRPSLRLAQLELLNGLPKPRVGPWWPCPMDNIVEAAYDEICASVWNLQQEECFFREAGLGSEYFWGKVMLRAPGFSPVHSHRSALQPPALAE
ncbi:neuroblastoma breakpoint family member 3-like isoform X4 [Oryctolagus cuniculus]